MRRPTEELTLQATKFKQIQDFKVRVLDFVAIYIKEMKKQQEHVQQQNSQHLDSLDIIKGLLKGLQVAHSDRNMILFERIKTVISMMARGPQNTTLEDSDENEEEGEKSGIKENKIVMTELMSQLLR